MRDRPEGWRIGWGWGWLLALLCLLASFILMLLGHMDVPVAILIAAICSHRL